MKTDKVLVTGADGFIGSHLTESLVRSGQSVRAFVCYNSFNSWGWLDQADPAIKESLEVFAGDIRDAQCVREAVRGCDSILHLAALIAIPYSYHAPDSYVDTNVKGTLNILQAAREVGVRRVIHTSTSEVYGTAQSVPISEDHPLQAQSPYAATKIAADQMAMAYHASFNLPVVIVRPFNTYGPRQSARAVIPTIITQIAAGERRIRLGALSPTRDFNYIRDTVSAFQSVLNSDQGHGLVFNFGSGYEISIGELAGQISKVMGVEIELQCEEERLRPKGSEVERLLADSSRARNTFGWQPAHAGPEGLRRGLAETAQWFSNKKNLNSYKTGIYII